MEQRRQRVEAILLLAKEPINSRKLAHFAGLADGTAARTVVKQINRLYDATARAFRVEMVAGGYQILTRPQFSPWLRRLEHVPIEVRLSAPALEALAVVAYRQPVLRADIEAIRGVGCGEILRQLMDRDLVRIGGRSDELGRPYLYTTTRRFLQLFGLQSLDQLPRAEYFARHTDPTGVVDRDLQPQHPLDNSSEQETSDVSTTSSYQESLGSAVDESHGQQAGGAFSAASLTLDGVIAAAEFDDEDVDEESYDDEVDDDFGDDDDDVGDDDVGDDDVGDDDVGDDLDDDDLDEDFDDDDFDDDDFDDDFDDEEIDDDFDDDEELEGDWEEVDDDDEEEDADDFDDDDYDDDDYDDDDDDDTDDDTDDDDADDNDADIES